MNYIAFFFFGAIASVGLLVLLCSYYRVENVTFIARLLVRREEPPPPPLPKPKRPPEPRQMGFARPKGPLH